VEHRRCAWTVGWCSTRLRRVTIPK
jgi:hypothetical protein